MLLICIDGLSWNLLESFCEKGFLPNFDNIIKNGVSGELQSMFPLISPRIWATIFTGKSPKKHGVEDFYISSESIRAKQVWEVIREHGYDVGVFRALTAFRPDQVYGFFLPGYLSAENDVYPVDLKFLNDFSQELRTRGSVKISPSNLLNYAYKLLRHGCNIRTLLKASWVYLDLLISNPPVLERLPRLKEVETVLNSEVFIHCLKRFSPDFAVFYDNGIDLVSHFYWKYMEPEFLDPADRGKTERHRDTIRQYYMLIDKTIGKMISLFGDETNIMIVSDHGFRARHTDTRIYKDRLDLEMYTRQDFAVNVSSLLSLLNLEDKIYGIKLGKGGIFRPKNPKVNLEEIEENLTSIRYKESGKQVFLVERMASYVNARLDIEALDKNQSVVLTDSSEYYLKDFVDFTDARSGDHSREAVLIAKGPDIRSREIIKGASVYDIFPTVLAIYRIPVSKDVDGKALTDIFTGKTDITYTDESTTMEIEKIASKELSKEEEDRIRQRLRELGYV